MGVLFTPNDYGQQNATLTFYTDVGAAIGQEGRSFSCSLTAFSTLVPETDDRDGRQPYNDPDRHTASKPCDSFVTRQRMPGDGGSGRYFEFAPASREFVEIQTHRPPTHARRRRVP